MASLLQQQRISNIYNNNHTTTTLHVARVADCGCQNNSVRRGVRGDFSRLFPFPFVDKKDYHSEMADAQSRFDEIFLSMIKHHEDGVSGVSVPFVAEYIAIICMSISIINHQPATALPLVADVCGQFPVSLLGLLYRLRG